MANIYLGISWVMVVVTGLSGGASSLLRCRGVAAAMSSIAGGGGRVLCLHGGGTNAEIMRIQTAKLRHQLRDEMEFEFLEGTHANLYVDPGIQRRFAGPFLSWYDVKHDAVRDLRTVYVFPR